MFNSAIIIPPKYFYAAKAIAFASRSKLFLLCAILITVVIFGDIKIISADFSFLEYINDLGVSCRLVQKKVFCFLWRVFISRQELIKNSLASFSACGCSAEVFCAFICASFSGFSSCV